MFSRAPVDSALPYDLAVKLADKVIDFEVEQIARQIRSHSSRDDWAKLAEYYCAHMVDRLQTRLGGEYGIHAVPS